ncbi:TPA: hypothetical protein ACX6R8_001331 [Photobacterium damselae]
MNPFEIDFIFLDRFLTIPANRPLYIWLVEMSSDENIDNLHFLYIKSQQYKKYNGAYNMSFQQWQKKLKLNLRQLEKKYK